MNSYLLNFSFFKVVINTLIYLRGFSCFDKAYKIFTIYLTIIFVLLLAFKYSEQLSFNKVIIIHTFIFCRFILLGLFYLELIVNIFYKKLIVLLLIVFSLLVTVSFCTNLNLLFKFNLLESFFSSFFITLFAFYYSYQQIGLPKKFYYINIAVMIYSFGGSVFYIFSNLLQSIDPTLLEATENLSLVFGVFSNAFVIYEWIKYYSKQKLYE